MKRTPLRRRTSLRPCAGLRRRTALRPAGGFLAKAAAPKRKRVKGPEAKRRERKRRALMKVAGKDRERVFQRQNGVCFAFGVSMVCTHWVQDPHELIPVGRGGPRESWNRVGVCRACHDAAQGRVGGNRLIFDWPGRLEGKKPNADELGNVTCRWLDGGGTGDGRNGGEGGSGEGLGVHQGRRSDRSVLPQDGDGPG